MLSRLLITGKIDINTPLCIISEIADAHGINYDEKEFKNEQYIQELIEAINFNETIYVKFPIVDINHWEHLARFVNKSVLWPQNLLIEAYNFLESFINNNILDKIPKNFISGIQTPDNIYYINPCILYRICKDFNISIASKTTIHEITQSVHYIKWDKSFLINKCISLMHKFDKLSLINLLMNNNNVNVNDNDNLNHFDYLPNQLTTYDELIKLENKISNIDELRLLINPKSNEGAIMLAAVNHYIDISKSKFPIDEYLELHNNKLNYEPIDNWLKYWFKKNKDIFDLKKTFNPLFPRKIYHPNILVNLANNYGYNVKNRSYASAYEFLQIAYTSETFYQGILPLTKKGKTIIDLDDVSEVTHGQLLSYGQIDISLNPITISELIDLFSANQNFTSPFGSEKVFTTTSIKKLKNILLCPHETNDNNVKIDINTLIIRKKLLDLIMEIELTNDDLSKKLVSIYKNGNYLTKQYIENLLNILLILGMHMRGWLGKGSYPVQEAPVPYDKEIEVALNVTQSIAKYKNEQNKNKDVWGIIDKLPLVKYKDDEYLASKDKLNGFTIGERIEIVMKGRDNPTIYSCIRMSSNYICSSVHKYSLILGLPAPFDIFKLRHIA